MVGSYLRTGGEAKSTVSTLHVSGDGGDIRLGIGEERILISVVG